MVRCLNCMREYEEEYEVCPYCGYIRGTGPQESYHLAPGMELAGKYQIGTVIGFGGFGVIYKAWDRNLEKIVAVKEYYPATFLNRIPGEKQVHIFDRKNTEAFEKGKREFLEEARNLAKFNQHPNIVHVYDFFEENGTAYFVMEYLEGCNLKTFLAALKKQGRGLSVETALQITESVLNALKAIHSAKVIHRDIKPGNIFVCKDSTIKLIDFGAARFSDADNEKTRTIIITPGYAPAEQYQTKSRQGAYTDIYATAAVLYEMLTGRKPEESIYRKVEDKLEEPSRINPAVPANISSAVMRALAVQPEIRFQNVDQFAKALRSGREVRDARQEIRHRKVRRAIWIAGMAAALVIVGVFCVYQYQRIRGEAVLEPASLAMWVSYTEEQGQEETELLYGQMTAEYLQNNEGIELEITALPESTYAQEVRTALQEGNGPDIFDSSALTEESDAALLADLGALFELPMFYPEDYFFLPDYQDYFPSQRQLPLTFEVPVLYENTLLADEAETDGENAAEENVAGEAEGQGAQNQEAEIYSQFADQAARFYLGTTADYKDVQTDLPGIYALSFPEGEREGSFHNLWSIDASADDAQYQAAIRLLYYLLSETSQDYLTVQNEGYLPLNRNVMDVYLDVNTDFEGLPEYAEDVTMRGES